MVSPSTPNALMATASIRSQHPTGNGVHFAPSFLCSLRPFFAHSVLPLLTPSFLCSLPFALLRSAIISAPLCSPLPRSPAVQCSQRHDCISCANTPDCGWCPTTRNTKQTKASKGKCQKGPSGCGGGYITPAAENDDSALDKCGSIEEFGASSLRRR